MLLDQVADVAFHLPGYTAQLFPMTNVITVPSVCDSAVSCTEALLRARPELEAEYDAKVLAVWGERSAGADHARQAGAHARGHEGAEGARHVGDRRAVHRGAGCVGGVAAGLGHQPEPVQRRRRRDRDRSVGDPLVQAVRRRQLRHDLVPGLGQRVRAADEPVRVRGPVRRGARLGRRGVRGLAVDERRRRLRARRPGRDRRGAREAGNEIIELSDEEEGALRGGRRAGARRLRGLRHRRRDDGGRRHVADAGGK